MDNKERGELLAKHFQELAAMKETSLPEDLIKDLAGLFEAEAGRTNPADTVTWKERAEELLCALADVDENHPAITAPDFWRKALLKRIKEAEQKADKIKQEYVKPLSKKCQSLEDDREYNAELVHYWVQKAEEYKALELQSRLQGRKAGIVLPVKTTVYQDNRDILSVEVPMEVRLDSTRNQVSCHLLDFSIKALSLEVQYNKIKGKWEAGVPSSGEFSSRAPDDKYEEYEFTYYIDITGTWGWILTFQSVLNIDTENKSIQLEIKGSTRGE